MDERYPGCFCTYIHAPNCKRVWLFKLTSTKSRSVAVSAPSPPCLPGCSDRQTLPLALGGPCKTPVRAALQHQKQAELLPETRARSCQ